MHSIGHEPKIIFHLLGHIVKVNPDIFLMTWLVMCIIIILAFFATRKLSNKPKALQNIFELLYLTFRDLVISTLGEKDARKYTPYIVTLFIFILFCNWIAVLPPFHRFIYLCLEHTPYLKHMDFSFLLKLPVEFKEPTKYLSTTLGLALISFFVVHTTAIKTKGLGEYLKYYMHPVHAHGIFLWFFFLNPFLYLNIIGELAKVVSHSFRLFGNILGGAIIIIIVSWLLKYLLLPPLLLLFFGLIVGGIQAFVFTMLALTYIAVARE